MRRSDEPEPLSPDRDAIRRAADALLRRAGAYDKFPTPVMDLVEAAGLRIEDTLFTDDLVQRMNAVDVDLVKNARGKLLGIVDILGRTIFVGSGVSLTDPSPLVLHETGHAYLDWQRDTFLFVQDSASCIAPNVRDLFEREATLFAWDLIFQVDRFRRDAERGEFSLRTPVDLARRYGAPAYAAIRRFVETNRQSCGLLVQRRRMPGRRGNETRLEWSLVQSESFARRFSEQAWGEIIKQAEPSIILPDAIYGARRQFLVRDREDRNTEFESHSLSVGIHDFTFIYPAGAIKAVRS